jgi:hypothetical protein
MKDFSEVKSYKISTFRGVLLFFLLLVWFVLVCEDVLLIREVRYIVVDR